MPEKELKLIGQRIKDIRKAAGLTQNALAERAWMHSKYVGQIERGEINSTVETLIKVANALNVPLQELFYVSDNKGKELVVKRISDRLRMQKLKTLELLEKMVKAIEK
ncbi:helix-turn-helix transcriptional regulator [candidate division TA06 bacterium]|uniref:Helix-turn-helix transcriptional regulator n=1 Tax=candidate division TA06 bacterium TaxID=2250710 RepID=A0A933IAS3_UNCT6|nr:helix-turn-helix transcriptional regulator [candidate division TA06 bacterium]